MKAFYKHAKFSKLIIFVMVAGVLFGGSLVYGQSFKTIKDNLKNCSLGISPSCVSNDQTTTKIRLEDHDNKQIVIQYVGPLPVHNTLNRKLLYDKRQIKNLYSGKSIKMSSSSTVGNIRRERAENAYIESKSS